MTRLPLRLALSATRNNVKHRAIHVSQAFEYSTSANDGSVNSNKSSPPRKGIPLADELDGISIKDGTRRDFFSTLLLLKRKGIVNKDEMPKSRRVVQREQNAKREQTTSSSVSSPSENIQATSDNPKPAQIRLRSTKPYDEVVLRSDLSASTDSSRPSRPKHDRRQPHPRHERDARVAGKQENKPARNQGKSKRNARGSDNRVKRDKSRESSAARTQDLEELLFVTESGEPPSVVVPPKFAQLEAVFKPQIASSRGAQSAFAKPVPSTSSTSSTSMMERTSDGPLATADYSAFTAPPPVDLSDSSRHTGIVDHVRYVISRHPELNLLHRKSAVEVVEKMARMAKALNSGSGDVERPIA